MQELLQKTMLKNNFILFVLSFFTGTSCFSSENLTILHVYSTKCVTEEPQLVLEKGEQWLNDNTDFTTQILSIPLDNAVSNMIAVELVH